MYCTKCGACIPDDVIACPQCGCATKNYRPEPHYQRSTPRRKPTQNERNQNADTRKFIVGAILMLLGVSWFCTGFVSGRIEALTAGIAALLGASVLIAWGVVDRKETAKKKDNTEELTRK